MSDRPNVLEERMSNSPGVPLISPLERYRDELLDFFCGKAGDLGGDLRGDVAELRIGLHRKRFPGVDAKAGQQHGHDDDRHAPLQAEADKLVNH